MSKIAINQYNNIISSYKKELNNFFPTCLTNVIVQYSIYEWTHQELEKVNLINKRYMPTYTCQIRDIFNNEFQLQTKAVYIKTTRANPCRKYSTIYFLVPDNTINTFENICSNITSECGHYCKNTSIRRKDKNYIALFSDKSTSELTYGVYIDAIITLKSFADGVILSDISYKYLGTKQIVIELDMDIIDPFANLNDYLYYCLY